MRRHCSRTLSAEPRCYLHRRPPRYARHVLIIAGIPSLTRRRRHAFCSAASLQLLLLFYTIQFIQKGYTPRAYFRSFARCSFIDCHTTRRYVTLERWIYDGDIWRDSESIEHLSNDDIKHFTTLIQRRYETPMLPVGQSTRPAYAQRSPMFAHRLRLLRRYFATPRARYSFTPPPRWRDPLYAARVVDILLLTPLDYHMSRR